MSRFQRALLVGRKSGAGQILGKPGVKPPSRIYNYDNGPRHTIGFEPDTFVDISEDWPAAIDWLGKLMALVRNERYQPGTRDSAQQLKETNRALSRQDVRRALCRSLAR